MRVRREAACPLPERTFFDNKDFESMADELRLQIGDEHFQEGHGVDIDLVFEKALKTTPDYEDLPAQVLGRTLFHKGRPRVQISRSLAEEAEYSDAARRRLRTTGAHEAGHIVCHGPQFLVDSETLSLFEVVDEDEPTILCREDSISMRNGYSGEWWEFQANRVMAALLLPKDLLKRYAKSVAQEFNATSIRQAVAAGHGLAVVNRLTSIFDVNQRVVVYRLQDLKILPSETQMDWGFEAE